MSNRTFACLRCRKLQRKDQSLKVFNCPICGEQCERVPWKLRVPAPSKVKQWDRFWQQYLFECRQIAEFEANPHIKELHLTLLNQVRTRDR